jgi:hypothetical protein
LNTQSRAFSPILRLNTQMGEKSPVRGFHALMLAGAPRPVSSGPVGCCPRAAGAGAIPGVTAARPHGQLARSRSVTAVGVPSDGRLAALISALGRPPGRIVQPGYRIPPDLAHRRRLVPRSPVQQPLLPVRRPVPGVLCDRPPVPRRQVAGQRGHLLARVQPRLRPGEAGPQQAQQDRPLPHRPAGPYPGGSSRPCFICSHKLTISGRLPPFHSNPKPPTSHQVRTQLVTAVLGGNVDEAHVHVVGDPSVSTGGQIGT